MQWDWSLFFFFTISPRYFYEQAFIFIFVFSKHSGKHWEKNFVGEKGWKMLEEMICQVEPGLWRDGWGIETLLTKGLSRKMRSKQTSDGCQYRRLSKGFNMVQSGRSVWTNTSNEPERRKVKILMRWVLEKELTWNRESIRVIVFFKENKHKRVLRVNTNKYWEVNQHKQVLTIDTNEYLRKG